MCTGFEMAALAAAAGGTYASISASQRAADAQQRALMQGIEQQEVIQDRANDRTTKYVDDTFDPTKRAANYEAEAAKAEQSFGDLLTKQAAAGEGDINASTTGALSDAYTQAKAQSTADAAQRSRTLSKLMSRQGATGGLFSSEALKGADYSSDMLGFGAQSAMNRNATNVKAGQAGQAGAGLAMLGGLLSGSSGVIAGMGNKPSAKPGG